MAAKKQNASKKTAKKKVTKKKQAKKKAAAPKKTGPKYILFVEEYLKNFFNAKQAYLKTYKPDATDRTAEVEGSKLLRKPEVKAYLDQRIEERKAEAILDANAVIDKYKLIVDANLVGTYVDMTKGELESMPEEIQKLVTEVKATNRVKTYRGGDTEEEEIYAVKFMSKDNAINALARYCGANEKDNKLRLDVNVKSFSEAMDELEIDDDDELD